MKQITTREKAFIGIGVLAVVAILVYFFVIPALQGSSSGPGLSPDEMEARIEAMEKLQDLGPTLTDLEKKLRKESGYGDIDFKRGIADSIIINFIAQLASKSEIGELEQLDAKTYTGKTSNARTSQRNLLQTTVDSIYMGQLAKEIEGINTDKQEGIGGPEQADVEEAKAAETPQNKPVFPPIPVDMPDEVKRSIVKWINQRGGKILQPTVVNAVLDEAGVDDDAERERIGNRIKIYGERVKQIKNEIVASLSILQPTRVDQVIDKTGLFTVKVIFKSRMDQLVKFLYNLQEDAKWLKIESMRVSISDRKEIVLAVELNMLATIIYD